MEYIGEYITKEYGLLRQILSYLPPCDLRNAKLVCSEWNKAVETLLDKNPICLVYNSEQENCVPVHTTLPAVIIQQPYAHIYPKKCKTCKRLCYLCPYTLSDEKTLFISLDPQRCTYANKRSSNGALVNDSYSFWQYLSSALLLPSSSGIKVSTFCVESRSSTLKQPITDEMLSRCTGGMDPIKCILIIAKAGKVTHSTWINNVLNKIVERQGLTFAVSGGDIRAVHCMKGFSEQEWDTPGVILITFRGENVIAHSEILKSTTLQGTEEFFQHFGMKVGPLPEDHTRVAFIAQCVDRVTEEMEKCESNAFRKTFPSVPQFGFRAYGEYGIWPYSAELTDPNKPNKKKRLSFDFSHTTSFVILTFKKVLK